MVFCFCLDLHWVPFIKFEKSCISSLCLSLIWLVDEILCGLGAGKRVLITQASGKIAIDKLEPMAYTSYYTIISYYIIGCSFSKMFDLIMRPRHRSTSSYPMGGIHSVSLRCPCLCCTWLRAMLPIENPGGAMTLVARS